MADYSSSQTLPSWANSPGNHVYSSGSRTDQLKGPYAFIEKSSSMGNQHSVPSSMGNQHSVPSSMGNQYSVSSSMGNQYSVSSSMDDYIEGMNILSDTIEYSPIM